jgi:hypothetical protein
MGWMGLILPQTRLTVESQTLQMLVLKWTMQNQSHRPTELG